MKQINFFSPFIDKHYGKQKTSRLMVPSIVIAVVAGSVLAYNAFQIIQLNSQKSDLVAFLNDPANQKAAMESHVRLESMELIDTYMVKIIPVKEQIDASRIIDKAFLDKLAVAKVGVSTIISADYDSKLFRLECEAPTKLMAAEFLHRLKLLGLFEMVKITEINQEQGKVAFTVECTIEGGGTDAIK